MKISEDKLKEGRELANKHGFKALFVNEKGEFFTNPSYAAASVGYDKEKFAEVPLKDGMGQGAESVDKHTNDLGKAADVIAAIDVAKSSDEVIAILDAEAAGKNRKSVIEAGNKKLDAIAQAAVSPSEKAGKAATNDVEILKQVQDYGNQVQDDGNQGQEDETNAKKAE